ncbi:hypothetical protein EZS27_004510 [termite gut metagenome]|jgi:hypothetical protein|uniref:Uncharacterized protein n=1 Tax=termite gut metagenome TaxID=433724 RepID=A0A5J4SQ70_9ZZZZ
MKRLIRVCALVCVLFMCSCSPEGREVKFGEVTLQDWAQGDTIVAEFVEVNK